MAKKKIKQVSEPHLFNWQIITLLALTIVAYYPTLSHYFVNWDDPNYIMNNEMITTFSWENLKKIFSTYYMGNYHPLVLLSFAFDFSLVKITAFGYHLHNLILHLVNTVLVYYLFFRLLKKNVNAAAFIALIFALHPMHVESVAWVSERKDLLYTAYFFLSLIAYYYYLQKQEKKWYLLSIFLFILSNLSKAQAVTLPVVLLLMDYFTSRPFKWSRIWEKIPFFLISLVFGIIAVFAQKEGAALNALGIPLSQSVFFGTYSLVVYLFKFFLPVNQCGVYEYPLTDQGAAPWYMYVAPLVLVALLFIIWRYRKEEKTITFGLLFFLVTIFPVLQFLPVGGAIVAERYTYIPYLGLSLIVAFYFWKWLATIPKKYQQALVVAVVLLMLLMTFLTRQRTLVWKDSVVFWTDVIEKYPKSARAYGNRAFIYNENEDYPNAIRDLSEGIKLDPTDSKKLSFYYSRGLIYRKIEKFDSALMDYTHAIRYNPDNFKIFFKRGILYTDKFNKPDSGIIDFKLFLSKYPDDLDGNFNLGIAFLKTGQADSAKRYFSRSLTIDPSKAQAYLLLGDILFGEKDYVTAYSNYQKAQQYGMTPDKARMQYLKERVK